MVATAPSRRQARSLRWRPAPWDEQHPDWRRLHQQLPADHRARLIDRLVERLDWQPLVADFCTGFGSAAWHPALLLKIALYELDRKALSPAQWFRDLQEHTPLQWLTRGACPCRAALYDGRRRLSPELLERLNQQVLTAARAAGLAPGRRGSLDGTFTAAKGSRHHLLNLQRLDKRLDLLGQARADDGAGRPVSRRPRWMAGTPPGRARQQARHQQARQRLLAKLARHERQQARRAKAKRQPAKRVVVSVSEPEAAVGKDKAQVARPLYDVQLLRDLDSPFLVGYGAFATATDAGLLPELLRRAQRLAGGLPGELLADAVYATVADLLACRQEQVTLYAPVKRAQPAGAAPGRQALPVVGAGAAEAKGYYGKEQFAWDAATQTYRCPAGQTLHKQASGREGRVNGAGVVVEKYGTAACAGCGQRPQCTRSQSGRQIKRLAEGSLVEELRQRMASAAGKELYRRRKETVELSFADAKEHRGLRQFSGYGLRQAEAQVGLLVLLNNGKAWLQSGQAARPAA